MACKNCGKNSGRYKKTGFRTYGECSIVEIAYLSGPLPFACFGSITGERYKWSIVKLSVKVDERDLGSVVEQFEAHGFAWKLVGDIEGVSAAVVDEEIEEGGEE